MFGKSIDLLVTRHGDYKTNLLLGSTPDGYVQPGSQMIGNLTYFCLFTDGEGMRLYQTVPSKSDSVSVDDAAAKFQDDGLVTLTWVDQDGVKHTEQFVYFNCHSEGIIFANRDGAYCYTADSYEHYTGQIQSNISTEEVEALEAMTEAQLQQIVQKRADLLQDLAAAYANSGLAVKVDTETGEIILDSGVLFAVNEYAISAAGQDFLKQFISIYTSVVFNEKYDGFVSQIMVEGHTDNVPYRGTGQLRDNLDLSVKRATTVTRLLVENKNISPLRVISAGRGEYMPIAQENSVEARAQNRRTEIILSPKLDQLLELTK